MKLDDVKEWFIKYNKLYFTTIELTQNCNFKCKHCYCADKEMGNLPLESFIKIIDKIYSTGCLFLNFTGGEIFTHKNFEEIYTYAKNKGFIIDLLTNASLINNRHIDLFKKLPPKNIAVTIYGTNEVDYKNFTGDADNFEKVIKSLELLKANKIPFVLRTVATKTLKKSLMNGEFDRLVERFDTTFKYDPIIFPKTNGDTSTLSEGLSIEEIIELEKNTERRREAWKKEICINMQNNDFCWRCFAGSNSMTIDFKGDAYICGLYRKNPISVVDNTIDKVMEHLQSIHRKHIDIVNNNECSKCKNRKICKWCPAYSYIYNGNDTDKVKFFCDLSKERVNAFG